MIDEADLEFDEASGLYWRRGTYDRDVIREQGSYKNLALLPTDILLDIGGNIGAFAARYGPHVKRTIIFEPDPDNHELLTKNLIKVGLHSWEAHRVAVSDHEGELNFYQNESANKGAHSLVIKRGRPWITVECVSLRSVLAKYEPRVIKCDIEGGEYQAFINTSLPPFVKEVIMELHLNVSKGRNVLAPALIAKFHAEGFKAVREPKITLSNWHTIGHWRRG